MISRGKRGGVWISCVCSGVQSSHLAETPNQGFMTSSQGLIMQTDYFDLWNLERSHIQCGCVNSVDMLTDTLKADAVSDSSQGVI